MDTNSNTNWQNTTAGKHLRESLSNEKTLSSIDHLIQRIDTLEKAVDKLTVIMEQGPGMVSMVTDMADETVRSAANNGVYFEERLGNALTIADKLTRPEMLENLEKLENTLRTAPGMVSMVADMADESIKKASDKGIYLQDRLGSALVLAERLTDPKMVEKLNQIMDFADQVPGLISMVMDTFDEEIKRSGITELDVKAFLEIGKDANEAIEKAKNMPHAKVGGIFSMIRTMKDPDRQRAIGYLMNIVKAYGKVIENK